MRRDLNPEFNNFATYELCFGNKIYVREQGYSIKSTGFVIDGIDGMVYMSDVPISKISGQIIFLDWRIICLLQLKIMRERLIT